MPVTGTSADSSQGCSVRVDCEDGPARPPGDEIFTVLLISRGTMSGAARIAGCLSQASLALIRTGLAFFTLGVTFLRYFAFSKWTVFDVALILFSLLTVYWGGKGYRRAAASEKLVQRLLAADRGLSEVLIRSGA